MALLADSGEGVKFFRIADAFSAEASARECPQVGHTGLKSHNGEVHKHSGYQTVNEPRDEQMLTGSYHLILTFEDFQNSTQMIETRLQQIGNTHANMRMWNLLALLEQIALS